MLPHYYLFQFMGYFLFTVAVPLISLQNQILFKKLQPKTEKNEKWKQEFELD